MTTVARRPVLILARNHHAARAFQDDLGLRDVFIVRSSHALRGIADAYLFALPRWQDGFDVDNKEEIERALQPFGLRNLIIPVPDRK